MKKAVNPERECARTPKESYERECGRVVDQLEGDPHALSLVVRIAEKLAGRSPIRRR